MNELTIEGFKKAVRIGDLIQFVCTVSGTVIGEVGSLVHKSNGALAVSLVNMRCGKSSEGNVFHFSNSGEYTRKCSIKILNHKPTIMTNVLDFFRELSATSDEKLLKEFGVESPIGTPTALGLELSSAIAYKANRTQIIDIVKIMKAERDIESGK